MERRYQRLFDKRQSLKVRILKTKSFCVELYVRFDTKEDHDIEKKNYIIIVIEPRHDISNNFTF